MEKEKKEDVVEAALFIAGRFLSIAELVVITGTNPITLREILARLKEKYANGAIILIEKNGEYKMDVEQEHSWLVNRLASGKAEFSKAEQETLAIIAHKQPITQATVVKVRSNKAYDHIKHLLQAGLIKAKKFKNTLQLELSESFHEYFRLG